MAQASLSQHNLGLHSELHCSCFSAYLPKLRWNKRGKAFGVLCPSVCRKPHQAFPASLGWGRLCPCMFSVLCLSGLCRFRHECFGWEVLVVFSQAPMQNAEGAIAFVSTAYVSLNVGSGLESQFCPFDLFWKLFFCFPLHFKEYNCVCLQGIPAVSKKSR